MTNKFALKKYTGKHAYRNCCSLRVAVPNPRGGWIGLHTGWNCSRSFDLNNPCTRCGPIFECAEGGRGEQKHTGEDSILNSLNQLSFFSQVFPAFRVSSKSNVLVKVSNSV